jgi:hypothetical protein
MTIAAPPRCDPAAPDLMGPTTASRRAAASMGPAALLAIGPAAYHTTNASPDRQRLAIGEKTQDAF